jgi:hydroxypyruvate reductase
MTPREALQAIFQAGVDACRAERLLPPHLPPAPGGKAVVLALGKSAIPMAQVVEASGLYERLGGLAVAPHGAPGRLHRLPIAYAGHPIPDTGSEVAARMLLHLAAEAGPEDLVLVLLSGGASALAAAPGKGLSLEAKRRVTDDLLRSGAPIAEINAVRRHLSLIKGGRLAAAAYPARVVTLAVSDVVGDPPEAIGSGPTVADATTVDEARAILGRYGVADPGAGWSETLKPGDPAFAGADYRIVGRNADALEAAAACARRLGFEALVLGEAEGEARTVGSEHAGLALANARAGRKVALISGGELTVTVTGAGEGGPSQEYVLALAIALGGAPGIWALAGDTDGIDGSGGAAGGFATPDTLKRARAVGLDPQAMLKANDSGSLLQAVGDRLVTGPTGINVNDLRITLIMG